MSNLISPPFSPASELYADDSAPGPGNFVPTQKLTQLKYTALFKKEGSDFLNLALNSPDEMTPALDATLNSFRQSCFFDGEPCEDRQYKLSFDLFLLCFNVQGLFKNFRDIDKM